MGVRVARQAEAGVRTSFPAGFLQIKERDGTTLVVPRVVGKPCVLWAMTGDGKEGPTHTANEDRLGPGVPRVMPSTCCTAHAT